MRGGAGGLKKRVPPKLASQVRDRVGEGQRLLVIPSGASGADTMATDFTMKRHADQCEQSQQARCHAQYGLLAPLACSLKAQMCADFFKHDLDRPATRVITDDLLRRQRHV